MIDKDTARSIALAHINAPNPCGDKHIDCVILDRHTREYDFGWVFCYQSREYMETGKLSAMLAGNAPLIVNRLDGVVTITGTYQPVERFIEQYKSNLASDPAMRSVHRP